MITCSVKRIAVGATVGLSAVFSFTPNLVAQNTFEPSLLVGEWSEAGQCNNSRYVFTSDGRYRWIENQRGKWTTRFQGVYRINEGNTVAIAETVNAGGNGLQISSLTQTLLSAKWINEDDDKALPVTYTRCSVAAVSPASPSTATKPRASGVQPNQTNSTGVSNTSLATKPVGTASCSGIQGDNVNTRPIQKATLEPTAGGYNLRFTEIYQNGQQSESLLELNNRLEVQSARTLGAQGGEWNDMIFRGTPVKIQPTGAFSIGMMVSTRSACDFSGTLQFVGSSQAQLFPGSFVQVNNSASLSPLVATTPSASFNSSVRSGSSASQSGSSVSASQASSASQTHPKEQQPSASQPHPQPESLPSDSPPMPPVTQPAEWSGGAAGEGGKWFPDAKSACQTLTKGRKLKALVPKYDDIKRFVAVSCVVEGLEPQYAEQTQYRCASGYQFAGEINGKCVLPNSESVALDIDDVTSGFDEIFIFRGGRGVEVIKVKKDGRGRDLDPQTDKPANLNTQMPNPKTGEPIENIKITVTTKPPAQNGNSNSLSNLDNPPKLRLKSPLPDLRDPRKIDPQKIIRLTRDFLELIPPIHSLSTGGSLERIVTVAEETRDRLGPSVSGIECESLGALNPLSCAFDMQMQTNQIWLNVNKSVGGAIRDALDQNR